MIKLHTHPLALNALKVELVFEEAHQRFEPVLVDITRPKLLGSSPVARNPLGRVPFIDDAGFVLAESNTIMRYLAHKWQLSSLYPDEPRRRAAVEEWMDFTSLHLNHPLTVIYLARWFVRQSFVEGWGLDLGVLQSAGVNLKRNLPILEKQLQQSEYLTGSGPTLPDLALIPFIAVAPGVGVSLKEYPAIDRWRDAMMRRESWARIADPRLPMPEVAICAQAS